MKIGNRIISLIMMIFFSFGVVGCSKTIGSNGNQSNKEQDKANDEIVELEVWSYFPEAQGIIEEFEKEYPNIKIKSKTFAFNEYELEYKKSMIKEEGEADLFIIDSEHYGQFNSAAGLENLLDSKYNAVSYKNDYDTELWELGKSLDKNKLLGIPISSAPIVTYYRADILEKYGFPSEPDKLAEYMKDKNNWLKIGETLSKDGIYIVQWLNEIVSFSTSDMPYFNEKLEYQRDNKRFQEAIDTAGDARIAGLAAYADIWSDRGSALLNDDKFAMLYLGSWGGRDLEAMVPHQEGKWRVTSLPFGLHGWSNASIMSIAENSKNKEAAWKFLEFYIFKYNDKEKLGSVSGYLPFRNNDSNYNKENKFLGGQKEQQFYEEVMTVTEEYPVTALDNLVIGVWDKIVNAGLDKGYSTEKIMQSIREEIDNKFAKEKEMILKEINK